MSTSEIERKAQQLKELQILIDEAQAEAEGIRDEIKAVMGDSEELRAGAFKITWRPIVSTRFDSAALKREAPELYGRYTRQQTTRRFCVA